MDIALARSATWPRVRAPRRWRPSRTLALAALLLLPLVLGGQGSAHERALASALDPYRFDLVSWEQRHLAARAGRIGGGLVGYVPSPDSASALNAYFNAPDPDSRARARAAAEQAIDAEIVREVAAEGLALSLPFRQPLVFPPASTWIGPPPQVLIVSPRARIEVRESVLLDPDMPAEAAAFAEARLDDADTSTLVVPIGGLATYPSMVLDSTSPVGLVSAAAHEWVHAFLFFRPLGQTYFTSYDGRAINETVADTVGRELGERIVQRLGIQPPPAIPSPGAPPSLDFVGHMRETRREVDRLLGLGQVAEAEAYMEQRRLELVQAGYAVRKLNQAYFAFYGSYTSGPAASTVSPIPALVQQLRQQSATLGEFLERAATIRGVADLAAEVSKP